MLRQAGTLQRLRLLAEQGLAGTRSEAETTRAALSREQGQQRQEVGAHFENIRAMLESKLREMRDGNETKLAEIQKTVNEQLHAAVEKQMNESFNRVIDQFTAVQKAMGDVQAVTAQIGDIKRLFSNVKTRGGWGETQVRAMLDDILPPGEYETNCKVRADSNDVVEFAVRMPMKGEDRALLPIDAKFPIEDYERLLAASDAGDAEAERSATRMLERRMRDEAKKIATKYINPPVTVEFAVLYLPTDALYAEVARIPGLIDDIGRDCRVLVMGPSAVPGSVAHDPSGVRHAGAGAKGGSDPRPAGCHAHRDAEDGRCAGAVGQAGWHVHQHDRAGSPAHARSGPPAARRGGDRVGTRGTVAGAGKRNAVRRVRLAQRKAVIARSAATKQSPSIAVSDRGCRVAALLAMTVTSRRCAPAMSRLAAT